MVVATQVTAEVTELSTSVGQGSRRMSYRVVGDYDRIRRTKCHYMTWNLRKD
jgi:hypothetical protein